MTSRTQSSSNLATTSTTNPIVSTEMVDNTTQVLQNVSLEVPLMTNEQLYPTPSMKDKISYDVEFDLRLTGCELIQTAGRLLKLPQTAMATGQVLFHRFYYSKSFVKNPMEYYAMAAIFLSTKIEECPRRVRDVLNVFHHIKQVRTGNIIKPMPIDDKYHNEKYQVIKAERRLLKELGFCVHVKHPHKMILIYLQAMECNQENLSQKAWNYMNDGLRTDIFLRYSPEIIACACIFLSARELGIPLPENPPWYSIFGADQESIKTICIRIVHLYTHKTRPLEELEKIVTESRERIEFEKKKAKEAAGLTEPEPEKKENNNPEEIKKTAEQIKKISATIAKAQSKASPNIESGHTMAHPNHSHHMTRHSSFNYNYYGHPGAYIDPYYGGYEHGYYGEMMYDSNLKRNKSASYLISSTHHKEYNYDYKKYPSEKIRSKDYKSVSRSRSRSRSRRPEKKSSKHRSRSRTADSIENGDKNSKSPSRHKKKKSHHKESRENRKRDKSREKKLRERDRSRDSSHHRSSKQGKDKHDNSDPRYIPICS